MNTLPRTFTTYNGLGAVALALGVIGGLLCIFPILGMPISTVGLIAGVVGLLVVRGRGGPGLRLCIAGISVAFLALILNLIIYAGPHGLVRQLEIPPKMPYRASPGAPESPPPER